jgi:hypothetical protein
MAFKLEKINVDNPRPANEAFTVVYEVKNDGPTEPAHEDHLRVWGSDGSQPVDLHHSIGEVDAGFVYMSRIEVPALPAGYYDVSVTFPDGSGAGDTIIVA